MKCEGKKIESEVVSDTLSPEWASAEAVFYRKNPEKPIKVQVQWYTMDSTRLLHIILIIYFFS